MCELCKKAKNIPEYGHLINEMLKEDEARLEYSKEIVKELRPLTRSIYSSMEWPIRLIEPMFEARTAYAVPNNYFQNLMLDGERLGNSFAHGAMRSIFFVGNNLVLFSKSVNFKEGKEFLTSLVLLHLQKGEYDSEVEEKRIVIRGNIEKPMKNLVTGKVEKKKVSFLFRHEQVKGRIVSKERVASSAKFKGVYEKYGGAQMKSASMDMEGYAITVPHFSPHPYLLQLSDKFGYSNNKEFQLAVEDYFRAHL
ncbi:hypothetical protein KKB44_01085 [Candidatus Micrarchaeota archaeon]|nr:hypothetical protein [Candidatus Micrarchaeota archaeon]